MNMVVHKDTVSVMVKKFYSNFVSILTVNWQAHKIDLSIFLNLFYQFHYFNVYFMYRFYEKLKIYIKKKKKISCTLQAFQIGYEIKILKNIQNLRFIQKFLSSEPILKVKYCSYGFHRCNWIFSLWCTLQFSYKIFDAHPYLQHFSVRLLMVILLFFCCCLIKYSFNICWKQWIQHRKVRCKNFQNSPKIALWWDTTVNFL